MYTTKTTLISKLADGCEIGWEEFEKTYRPLILSVASKQGVPPAECDDILQLVMLALFNNGNFNYSSEKQTAICKGISGTELLSGRKIMEQETLPLEPWGVVIVEEN